MKETCKSCRFARIPKDSRFDYICCLYPKRIGVDSDHWCGQYEYDTERIEVEEVLGCLDTPACKEVKNGNE